jgi:hypothetical protein
MSHNLRIITVPEDSLSRLFDEKLKPVYEKIAGIKEFMNIEEAASFTGFSKENIRRAVRGGSLARMSLKDGKKDIFHVDDLRAYMKTLRTIEK